jgi:SAM-dependent methyltransferase
VLELGCGRGLNACVLAAANPDWRVTGIDFMPAAIAEARRLAAEAGLDNLAFIEADLSDFVDTEQGRALPEADVVTAHGVWSWVADPVRAGIVRLLAAKLRAGGLFHVSYNALPAQQALLGMQRLMREAGRRQPGRSDRQVLAGRALARELAEAGALHLTSTETVREVLPHLETLPPAYLTHEYMNESWRPCFHADVAAALAPARLEYAASVRLMENFPEMMLTPAQRAIQDRFDDPLMRELVTDTCINRTLRHDVYVRGATRLSARARDAALGAVPMALATAPEAFVYTLKLPAGEAQLPEPAFRPLVEALAHGPRDIASLIAARGAGPGNPGEVAMVLAGTLQALVATRPDAPPSARAQRFNTALARRHVRLDALNAAIVAASGRLGAGLPMRAGELLLVARIGEAGGVPDPLAFAAELLPAGTEAERAALADTLAMILRDRLAVWQRAGVV